MRKVDRITGALLICAAAAGSLAGQTQVDLKTESKNADFTGHPFTKPMKMGPTLPVACTTGEMFFNLASPNGQNLYGCTSTNTWSLEITGGGVTTSAQLTDFTVTLGSSTVLNI